MNNIFYILIPNIVTPYLEINFNYEVVDYEIVEEDIM